MTSGTTRILGIMALALAACGGSGTSAPEPPSVHAISGKVAGSPGSRVRLTSLVGIGGNKDTTAGPDGSYEFTGLPDGSYRITPTIGSFLLYPTERLVTLSGADLTHMDFTDAALPAVQYALDGDAVDESLDHDDGTIVGGVTPTSDRHGVAAGAMAFDDGYIVLPCTERLRFAGDHMTISAWIDITGSSGDVVDKAKRDGMPGGLSLWVENGLAWAAVSGDFAGGGFFALAPRSEATVTANVWHHVAMTWEPARACVYLDGRQEDCIEGGWSMYHGIGDFYIGAVAKDGGPEPTFAGSMDDVRIWDRTLSTEEIAALYAEP